MTLNEMLTIYQSLAASDGYIIGYTLDNIVYATVTDEIPFEIIRLDKASRNGGNSLRVRINKKVKCRMVNASFEIGTIEELKNGKYNRGEKFEKMVKEFFGQKWEKDCVPFDKDGDITINDIKFQIKFENATIINEKTLIRRLEK